MNKYCFFFILLSFYSLNIFAQQFEVKRFRVMPNDISAYMHSVKDLNDEACALIKVVGDKDFVFSTPLGIVKRIDEVGEIWLYVPHGTTMLTVKHPKFGVLRNYSLGKGLESRLTYELVLETPLIRDNHSVPFPKIYPVGILSRPSYPTQLETISYQGPRYKEPLRYFFQAGIGVGDDILPSIRMGVMRRHGMYVYAESNLRTEPSISAECNRDGYLDDGTLPYYTDKTQTVCYAFSVGGIHRVINWFYFYEGVGYGKRSVVWNTIDSRSLLNRDLSDEGLFAELGVMYRWNNWLISGGASALTFHQWKVNIGIGINF